MTNTMPQPKKTVKPLYRRLTMPGGRNGERQDTIPMGVYHFLTVTNPTQNTIYVYDGRTTAMTKDGATLLQMVPPQTALTIPIQERGEFTFIWQDGGGVDTKEAQLTYTQDNLNINTALGSKDNMTVTLASDSVGLARSNQLPAVLAADGGLKVHVLNGDTANERLYLDALPTTEGQLIAPLNKTRLDSVLLSNDNATQQKAKFTLNGKVVLTAVIPANGSIVVDAPIVINAGESLRGSADATNVYAAINGKVIG